MNHFAYKTIKYKKDAQKLFSAFANDRMPFLLESRLNLMGMGRYSFFSSEPFLTFKVKNGISYIEREGETQKVGGQPLVILRGFLRQYDLGKGFKTKIPFLCGAVGFFSYDFGFSLENIHKKNSFDSQVPELMFGFYDVSVCIDHLKNELVVFSSGFPKKGNQMEKRARARLDSIVEKIQNFHEAKKEEKENSNFLKQKDLYSNFSKGGYIKAITKAKDYIRAGDIYQVNLSQKFRADFKIDDWQLYRRLLKNFPVSFSAFFSAAGGTASGGKDKDFSIISASPEKFLNFDGRVVSTRPMKGTRRRTVDPSLNSRLREDLIRSKKEKAELLMIVDLERNDLGRVCDYGTIRVKELRMIEAYKNVFQATAEIEGVLHKAKDRLDLVKACFPGGSVTGCPKIRAMEVIEELEPDSRSIYTGSLGYLSFHNTLQLNILIRSFLKKGDEVFFNVGGGIVADSKPDAEYEETLIKAEALKRALMG